MKYFFIFIVLIGFTTALSAQQKQNKPEQFFFPPAPPASSQPDITISNNQDLPIKIKLLVNKLNSTAQPAEQTYAKNQLIKIGTNALSYLHNYIKTDKRTYVRVQLTFVLAKIKDKSSIPVLEDTAQSKYIALNSAAVKAIGEIGGKEAIESLKKIKSKNTDPKLIPALEDALKKASNQQK